MTTELISPKFLQMLRCPETGTPVRMAEEELVERLNRAVESKQLKNVGGSTVSNRLDGALVREDSRVAYPIVHALPIMLIDDGIPLDQPALAS